MKPFLLTFALLLFSMTHFIAAQEDLLLLLQSENQNQPNEPRKLRQKKQKRLDEDLYHQHKFLNDCSSISRTDYALPADYVSNFVQITEWQSYRGTRNGIIMTDNNTPIRITTENSNMPENNITALARDDSDQLWIGTYSSGIVIGTGNDVLPFRIHTIQTRDQHVASIYVDYTGLVWVVYKNGGIECFLNEISCSYFPSE